MKAKEYYLEFVPDEKLPDKSGPYNILTTALWTSHREQRRVFHK
jgi:hypothetical protein